MCSLFSFSFFFGGVGADISFFVGKIHGKCPLFYGGYMVTLMIYKIKVHTYKAGI